MAAYSLITSMGDLNRKVTKELVIGTNSTGRTAKRLSWAPESDLCQVRLFLAEDAPIEAGQTEQQDQLEPKKSMSLKSDVPPGFERSIPISHTQREDSISAQTAWRCPPRFVLNPIWQVVAGEESAEIKTQFRRQLRNLEAVYPRVSAIPPWPMEPEDAADGVNCSESPLIPLVPIEEEEYRSQENHASQSGLQTTQGEMLIINNGVLSDTIATSSVSSGSDIRRTYQTTALPILQSHIISKADIEAAAAAAFEAMMKSNEQGSMIDQDLLIKILSDPKLIETLIGQHIKSMDKNNKAISDSSMEVKSNEFSCKQNHNDIMSAPKPQPKRKFSIPADTHTPFFANPGLPNHGLSVTECIPNPWKPRTQLSFHLQTVSGKKEETQSGSEIEVQVSNQTTVMLPISRMVPLQNDVLANPQVANRPGTFPIPVTSQPVLATSQPDIVVPSPVQPVKYNRAASINEQYYKNLIQQHGCFNKNDHVVQRGMQNHEYGQDQHPNGQRAFDKLAQSKSLGKTFIPPSDRFRTPCLYFNTPKGCWRGSSCYFLHESRPRADLCEIPQPKRIKMEIEAPSMF